MVPNLANIAKNYCFPKNLPIFMAIFLNAKNLPVSNTCCDYSY